MENRKNRMYGQLQHFCLTRGQGFKSIRPTVSQETCAQILQNNIKLDFGGTVLGPLDRIPQIPLDLVSPAMDFHEKVQL